jgi:hypothetical protein
VLIIDDILLSPIKGFMWIMRELHKAAEQELENEAERLTSSLSDLYMMLETGILTEEEFAQREKEILDRLDSLHNADDDEADAADGINPDADASETDDDSDDESDEDEDEDEDDDEWSDEDDAEEDTEEDEVPLGLDSITQPSSDDATDSNHARGSGPAREAA